MKYTVQLRPQTPAARIFASAMMLVLVERGDDASAVLSQNARLEETVVVEVLEVREVREVREKMVAKARSFGQVAMCSRMCLQTFKSICPVFFC